MVTRTGGMTLKEPHEVPPDELVTVGLEHDFGEDGTGTRKVHENIPVEEQDNEVFVVTQVPHTEHSGLFLDGGTDVTVECTVWREYPPDDTSVGGEQPGVVYSEEHDLHNDSLVHDSHERPDGVAPFVIPFGRLWTRASGTTEGWFGMTFRGYTMEVSAEQMTAYYRQFRASE